MESYDYQLGRNKEHQV